MRSARFGTDVRTVAELDLPGGAGEPHLSLGGGHAARYWRLIANAATGGGRWGISQLAFRTDASNDGGPADAKAARELESATV